MIGSILGSFFGVITDRLPRGESIISPPSHCDNCKTPLKLYDNIPIFGYLNLKGKCRNCGNKIPLRFFLLELTLGIVFAVMAFIIF